MQRAHRPVVADAVQGAGGVAAQHVDAAGGGAGRGRRPLRAACAPRVGGGDDGDDEGAVAAERQVSHVRVEGRVRVSDACVCAQRLPRVQPHQTEAVQLTRCKARDRCPPP